MRSGSGSSEAFLALLAIGRTTAGRVGTARTVGSGSPAGGRRRLRDDGLGRLRDAGGRVDGTRARGRQARGRPGDRVGVVDDALGATMSRPVASTELRSAHGSGSAIGRRTAGSARESSELPACAIAASGRRAWDIQVPSCRGRLDTDRPSSATIDRVSEVDVVSVIDGAVPGRCCHRVGSPPTTRRLPDTRRP